MSNLGRLILAVEQLGDLADELVFVGGCTTELFITDPDPDTGRIGIVRKRLELIAGLE